VKIIKFIEKNFWLPLSLSLLVGLLFPYPGKNFSILVIPILMLNFFLACLKIDFFDVVEHIKKPKFIFYILSVCLLLIPIVIYGLFQFVNQDVAIGMLLLASMPPGVNAVVMTDIFEGNLSLSMAISIPAYLISPFTISILFFLLTKKQINLDLVGLFKTLLLVNFLPLVVAQIVHKTGKNLIERTKNYYNFVSICGIALLVYIVVAVQANKILENPLAAVIDVAWMYLLFIALFTVGYFVGFWKNKSDKIALAVTKSYMNNGLAIGLAATFFSPKIALFIVLSEVPWTTTQGIFKYIIKHLG